MSKPPANPTRGREAVKKTNKSRRRSRTKTPEPPKVAIGSIKDVQPEFVKLLHDEAHPVIRHVFDKIEQNFKIKREYVAYLGVGCIALYFVFGKMAQLFCNLIGFAYPAYKSVLAIRTEEKDDDTEWLTYWVVYACFTCVDCIADTLMAWAPVTFILYLVVPQTRGALMLYIKYIDPGVTRLEELYDQHFSDGFIEGITSVSKASQRPEVLKNSRTTANV